jgi:NAD(P)-dependent dehydrogenase (short-subunit alcohol dehydrogenase family)
MGSQGFEERHFSAENAKQRLAKYGVDILINNAGIGFNAELIDTPLAEWQANTIDVVAGERIPADQE